jgi:hypothetical protein
MTNRYDLQEMLHEIVEDEKQFSKKKNVMISQAEIKNLLKQKKRGSNKK